MSVSRLHLDKRTDGNLSTYTTIKFAGATHDRSPCCPCNRSCIDLLKSPGVGRPKLWQIECCTSTIIFGHYPAGTWQEERANDKRHTQIDKTGVEGGSHLTTNHLVVANKTTGMQKGWTILKNVRTFLKRASKKINCWQYQHKGTEKGNSLNGGQHDIWPKMTERERERGRESK